MGLKIPRPQGRAGSIPAPGTSDDRCARARPCRCTRSPFSVSERSGPSPPGCSSTAVSTSPVSTAVRRARRCPFPSGRGPRFGRRHARRDAGLRRGAVVPAVSTEPAHRHRGTCAGDALLRSHRRRADDKAIIELSKTSRGLMAPQCGLAPGFVGIVGAAQVGGVREVPFAAPARRRVAAESDGADGIRVQLVPRRAWSTST